MTRVCGQLGLRISATGCFGNYGTDWLNCSKASWERSHGSCSGVYSGFKNSVCDPSVVGDFYSWISSLSAKSLFSLSILSLFSSSFLLFLFLSLLSMDHFLPCIYALCSFCPLVSIQPLTQVTTHDALHLFFLLSWQLFSLWMVAVPLATASYTHASWNIILNNN